MCCAPSFCLSWLEGRFLGNATRRFSCTSLGNEIKTTEKCSDIPAQPLLFKAQHFPRMAPSDVWRYFFVYTPLSVWNTSGNWRLLRQTILLPLEFRRLSLFATGLSPARTKTKVLRVQLHGLVLRRDCEISSCSQADRGKMDAGSLFFWPAYEGIIKKRNGFQQSISFVFILLFHLCHRFDSWERFVVRGDLSGWFW